MLFSICRKKNSVVILPLQFGFTEKSNYKSKHFQVCSTIQSYWGNSLFFLHCDRKSEYKCSSSDCFAIGISLLGQNMVIERPREPLTRFTHARRSVYRSEAFYLCQVMWREAWPVSVYCNRADVQYPVSYLSWNPWNALRFYRHSTIRPGVKTLSVYWKNRLSFYLFPPPPFFSLSAFI